MNVLAIAECLHEHRILRKMCHHAQLDLRVVRGEQIFSLFGNERRPNLTAQFAANRNVLQIRIARAEPPGGGAGLRKTSVQASRLGMNELGQRVHISGLQLGNLAVLNDFGGQWMLRGQLL